MVEEAGREEREARKRAVIKRDGEEEGVTDEQDVYIGIRSPLPWLLK